MSQHPKIDLPPTRDERIVKIAKVLTEEAVTEKLDRFKRRIRAALNLAIQGNESVISEVDNIQNALDQVRSADIPAETRAQAKRYNAALNLIRGLNHDHPPRLDVN